MKIADTFAHLDRQPCRATGQNLDWAGIDIFGFDQDGKIVEHWDVLQWVSSESKHSNSMFQCSSVTSMP